MSHHSMHPREGAKSGLKPHLKWTMIVGVVLMLISMLVYVMTMDEAVQPGQPIQQPMPAAP